MGRPLIFKAFLGIAILALPYFAAAGEPRRLVIASAMKNFPVVISADTTGVQQQNDKNNRDQQKGQEGKPNNKPEIIEVPKARNQGRPIVVKPNIPVKPIKIIRPKIKRP